MPNPERQTSIPLGNLPKEMQDRASATLRGPSIILTDGTKLTNFTYVFNEADQRVAQQVVLFDENGKESTRRLEVLQEPGVLLIVF